MMLVVLMGRMLLPVGVVTCALHGMVQQGTANITHFDKQMRAM
jgi:hypothetical protein